MGKRNAFHRWMEATDLDCVKVRDLLRKHGVKVTRQAVHHWRTGTTVPRMPTLKILVIVTAGAVPLESW